MSAFDPLYRNRLINRKELRRLVPYSDSQIYRMEKAGRFPKRIRIGPGRVAWSYADVSEWIECKRQGRVWTADGSSGQTAHG